MSKNILLVNGHPDPNPARSSAVALAAYETAARDAGHHVRRVDVGALDFPLVISGKEIDGEPLPVIRGVMDDLEWCEQLTISFPLWLGSPPALLKGLFEHLGRYDFAFDREYKPLLTGRGARLIVTTLITEEDFAADSITGVLGFSQGVLAPAGFSPIGITQIPQMFRPDLGDQTALVEDLGRRGI